MGAQQVFCLLLLLCAGCMYYQPMSKESGSTTCMSMKKQYLRSKFLGIRIPFYSNSCSTFQLELLASGDISPNPGPVTSPKTDVITYSTPKKQSLLISYDRDILQSLNPALNNSTTKPSAINLKIWSRVGEFKFRLGNKSSKPRGKRGGRRKNLPKAEPDTYTNQADDLIKHIPVLTTTRTKTTPTRLRETTSNSRCANLVQVKCVSRTCTSTLKCNFVAWNAQSMNNKTTLICDHIKSNHVDIMAISESWLYGDDRDKKTLADVNTMLPDHNLYHKPRKARGGGGVCVIIKKGFTVSLHESFDKVI